MEGCSHAKCAITARDLAYERDKNTYLLQRLDEREEEVRSLQATLASRLRDDTPSVS
jgi:hypothetical protein